MKIRVITSCTGEKRYKPDNALTQLDFQNIGDAQAFAAREDDLAAFVMPAESMYTGLQHVRLVDGIAAYRELQGANSLDLWIVSAGYGIIPGNRRIVPYELTFQGMKAAEINAWSSHLGIPEAARTLFAQPADLTFVLLGNDYLKSLQLDDDVCFVAPTIFFASAEAKRHIQGQGKRIVVPLSNKEAKRLSCGLVGLKGEITRQLLRRLATDEETFRDLLLAPDTDILSLVDAKAKDIRPHRPAVRPNPAVDAVISIPSSWWQKEHRTTLRYFIPEWHDLVDPDYDFLADVHSGGSGDWSNEVYAHQLYAEPNYDGILVSKIRAEQNAKAAAHINELGVHRLLRVPRDFPIMGDCGAFGYIMQERPPYTTDEILDYYTRLGFDYGVSIDHLIVSGTDQWKQERYELTIHNAEEFLREHRKAGLQWEPVGAVQGWDPKSYAEAARQYVAMGYRYIALGGLVRSSTQEILQVLEEVHEVVPDTVQMHLFGIARTAFLSEFARLGVRSIDSASHLRQAWEENKENYFTLDGSTYAAIRIPSKKSPRANKALKLGLLSEAQFETMERDALNAVRSFDRGAIGIEQALDALDRFDRALKPSQKSRRALNKRTLALAPWKSCPCDICQRDGVEVVIFRGNNRNRRRGFHNIYVFYRLAQRVLAGGPLVLDASGEDVSTPQLSLFALATAGR